MAKHRVTTRTFRSAALLALLGAPLLMSACATPPAAAKPKPDNFIQRESRAWPSTAPAAPKLPPPPDFVPATEEIAPFKTKMVHIVVRNSALGDVLHVVAEAGRLNLLIDRDVALDQPVTLSLRNVSVEDALKSIFSTVDAFYSVTNNLLKVESVATRIFELGHPALVSNYSMDVGGDILGGAMVTAGGGGGSGNIKGTITSGTKADGKAFDFWESLEKSLDALIARKDSQGARPATARPADARSPQGVLDNLASRSAREGRADQIAMESTAGRAGSSGDGQPQQSITVNRLTGTIMITAARKNMEKAERYLDNVKKVLNRQVMIEARIVEVQLNDGLNFGIDWSFLENVRGLGTVGTGFGAINSAAGFANARTAAAAASKFQLGLSTANFQGLLTALETQGDVKTISNPKISVMNGHASILTVGTNTSYIAKVTSTTTTGTAAVTTFSVETGSILSGMIVGIVPYISEAGEITINITPITSNLTSLQEKSIGTAGNQTIISIPTVALREMTTTVKMRDGQIVILGGLISNQASENEEKIPVLGDLPFLGKLFTRTNNTTSRSELVLLLRPQIISSD